MTPPVAVVKKVVAMRRPGGYPAGMPQCIPLPEEDAGMDYKRMTAPCGLDCFNCPMYRAVTDEKLREKLAQSMGIPAEKAQCGGCRPQNGIIGFLGMQQPCGVYRCISARNLDFCGDCPDFPCDNLHPYADRANFVPHNTKVFNLCLIRKMGLDKWAAEKAKSVKDTYFRGTFKL